MWRVRFASDEGPSLEEADALVRACPGLRDRSVVRVHEVLRGTAEVIVSRLAAPDLSKLATARVEDLERLMRAPVEAAEDAGAAGLLVAAGARVTPLRNEYGPSWLASAVGLAPLRDGEHRWTFTPSFLPELLVSAVRELDGWRVEVRRPDVSLWASSFCAWRSSVERLGFARDGTLIRLEVPLQAPARARIERARGLAGAPRAGYADEWLGAVKAAPNVRPRSEVLDGMGIHLAWREGDTVHERHAWSGGKTAGVDRALALSGLTLAGCVESAAILEGIAQLRV